MPLFIALLASLLLGLPPAQAAELPFGAFLQRVNLTAEADLPGFHAELSHSFAVPVPEVRALVHTVGSPANAYLCLRIGHLAGVPVPRVVQAYERHRGQGWGAVAKAVGIKPGSAAFHALKQELAGPGPKPGKPADKRGAKGKDAADKGQGKGKQK